MGLGDWHKVMWALEARDIDYGVSMVAHPIVKQATLHEFVSMFEDKAQLIQFQSWAGLMYPYNGRIVKECDRLFEWITYDWQGKRIKCCYDINGQSDCRQCTEGVQI